jgi:hypothetical protein
MAQARRLKLRTASSCRVNFIFDADVASFFYSVSKDWLVVKAEIAVWQ